MPISNHAMLLVFFLIVSLFSSFPSAFSNVEGSYGLHSEYSNEGGEIKAGISVNASLVFNNVRLEYSFKALHAWKKNIYSDPFNLTANWEGPDICSYNGVFCSKALDDPSIDVVGGLDLNGGEISGELPKELGLLNDTALFHINSNRFTGKLPGGFAGLSRIREVDLSNNNFTGTFPMDLLNIPGLKYLDLRYNNFHGEIPKEVFEKDLDALFLNDNQFSGNIPENIGDSKMSVAVLANNELSGCIPSSIGRMSSTLNEFILSNNKISGCLPEEIGLLSDTTVFDVSFNSLVGSLPESLSGLAKIEELSVSNNKLTGNVPGKLCGLPNLWNFNFSDNYFSGEDPRCVPSAGSANEVFDNRNNCIPPRPDQKTDNACNAVTSQPIECARTCGVRKFQSVPSHSGGVSWSFSGQSQLGRKGVKSSTDSNFEGFVKLEREQSSSPPPTLSRKFILPPETGIEFSSPPPPTIKGYY